MKAIDARNEATKQFTDALKKSEGNLEGALRSWVKQTSAPEEVAELITDTLAEAISQVQQAVREETESARSFAYDADQDSVVATLRTLIGDRVGKPFSKEDHQTHVSEAKRRIEHREPP